MDNLEKCYTVPEAAALLCLSVRTVRYWISAGKISAIKISGGRQWVITESEIRRLRNGN